MYYRLHGYGIQGGADEQEYTNVLLLEIVLIYFGKVCFNEWEKSVSTRPVLVCA